MDRSGVKNCIWIQTPKGVTDENRTYYFNHREKRDIEKRLRKVFNARLRKITYWPEHGSPKISFQLYETEKCWHMIMERNF